MWYQLVRFHRIIWLLWETYVSRMLSVSLFNHRPLFSLLIFPFFLPPSALSVARHTPTDSEWTNRTTRRRQTTGSVSDSMLGREKGRRQIVSDWDVRSVHRVAYSYVYVIEGECTSSHCIICHTAILVHCQSPLYCLLSLPILMVSHCDNLVFSPCSVRSFALTLPSLWQWTDHLPMAAIRVWNGQCVGKIDDQSVSDGETGWYGNWQTVSGRMNTCWCYSRDVCMN